MAQPHLRRPSASPSHSRRAALVVLAMLVGSVLAVLPVAWTQESPASGKSPPGKASPGKVSTETAPVARTPAAKDAAKVDPEPPLFTQEPFDVLILDEENKRARIKVEPLNFPNRRLPTNRTGELVVRLVGDDAEYEISWKNITDVKLFEEMLLEEGNRLVAAGKLDEAFDYLNQLRVLKPDWPGLKDAIDRYLFADARSLAGKDKQRFAESLAILEELYARNPEFKASATKSVMDVISDLLDRVVTAYYEKKEYRSGRTLLKRMGDKYQAKRPPSVNKWIADFEQLAIQKRDQGREQLQRQQYRPAIASVKEMQNIWPDVAGGAELIAELSAAYPIVFVGVTQPAADSDSQQLDNWPARRTGRLVHRTLVEFLGAGPEGGQYLFPWGTMEHSEDQRRLVLRLNRNAATSNPRLTGYDVARRVVQLAASDGPDYNPAWASLLLGARVENVMTVEFDLRRPHVLPEAWLRVPLVARSATSTEGGNGLFRVQGETQTEKQFLHKTFRPGDRLAEIVEQSFADSQSALAALRRGDIDVVDRLFPADAVRILAESPRNADIKIVPYAHPTVHVLLPNTKNPFLENRDFRRALVVAIDRARILQQELLGGRDQPGCRVLSGPFPASSSEADPLGYAYDETIQPWMHNALFAKVLSLSANRQVAELAKKRGDPPPKLTRFVLGFPGSEIARIGSQAIQAYLSVIGIEVELREFPPGVVDDLKTECDLVYKEVAIWEPVTDARRMLGAGGVAPTDSPYVAQSLRWLDESQNWGDIRSRLIDIHRSVYNDVAVLPLWQVVDYFAYHKRIRNISERPVVLYQNVEQWRIGAEPLAQ